MIVDDEQYLTRLLKQALERALPVEAFPFQDARSALAWIESGEADPDAVVCDLRMPGMDGLEFCRELKKRDFKPPVIIFSGYVSPEAAAEAKGLGVTALIEKPTPLKEFVALIRSVLPSGESAD